MKPTQNVSRAALRIAGLLDFMKARKICGQCVKNTNLEDNMKPRLIGVRLNGSTMWTSKNDTFIFYSIEWAYKSALLLEGTNHV